MFWVEGLKLGGRLFGDGIGGPDLACAMTQGEVPAEGEGGQQRGQDR